MKITQKILHLPPYISTSWDQIRALYLKEKELVVCLIDGVEIRIPGLNDEIIQAIFNAHSAYLEGQQNLTQEQGMKFPFPQAAPNPPQAAHTPEGEATAAFRLGFGTNMDSFASAMHHNAAQANLPDLPKEVLGKISAIAKIIAPEDIQNVPKPEAHCNCVHCQIARAIHDQLDPTTIESPQTLHIREEREEAVSEEELKFQNWNISQIGDKLFSVVNRLDPQEKYSVFLGEPVGCTCGKAGCEHILAVLNS
jgi:hypothetical protein